jgi:hypothetical protein
MIGARVGNWYLEAEIGRGPHGAVYRARGFDDPDRRAAVKVLTDPAARDPAFAQRFPAEMLTLQRLDHPNVARAFDSGTHGGLPYFATELVEGTDGVKLLEAGRRPWPEVLSVAVQVARALKHGHNRNVLHRDLKPAHVMVTADGTVKVLGFGLARVIPPALAATPVIGTAAYLPPETASGKPPTRRSDFYSLGGVLYTLLTGRPPFTAATLVELTHRQCYALPERPGMLVRNLPPEFDEFVCTLIDKNPSRRPATAQNLLDELERLRGKLERKGEKLVWPAKLVPDTAEMAALPSNLGGSDGEDEGEEEDARPLLRRPAVVVPLFALVVAAIVAVFAWPRPGPDELWAAAAPLVESDDPADWDRAWDDYLDPLERRYPGQHAAEVAAAKTRIRDRKELRKALTDGSKVDYGSDAERAYQRGLRLAQLGDTEAARRTWRAVVAVYGAVESERRWVDLARAGLAALDQPANRPRGTTDRAAFEAALAHARRLAADGKAAAAAAAFHALEELFRDDPGALEQIRSARGTK